LKPATAGEKPIIAKTTSGNIRKYLEKSRTSGMVYETVK